MTVDADCVHANQKVAEWTFLLVRPIARYNWTARPALKAARAVLRESPGAVSPASAASPVSSE